MIGHAVDFPVWLARDLWQNSPVRLYTRYRGTRRAPNGPDWKSGLFGLLCFALLGLLVAASRYQNAAKTARTQAGEIELNLAGLRRLEARNRANLARLLNGTEHRFGRKSAPLEKTS